METKKKLNALNGSKLEYKVQGETDYKRIYGLKTIPDIGGTPNKIDTTNLDNEVFETNIMGLKPAPEMDFDFDLEEPTAESNIYIVYEMEKSKAIYNFKLTYKNGIIAEWDSQVKTTIKGGQNGDLQGFTMHLAPEAEVQITLPTTTQTTETTEE